MKNKYEPPEMMKHLAIYKIFHMIGRGSSVLDVGCFNGFLGDKLKREKECALYGVDNDVDAVRIAKSRLDKAFVCDIEKSTPNLKKKFFDYIIFADVLEHTRDPQDVIRRFAKFLKPGGFVLISLPNVAHPIVRIGLLLGKWDYKDTGILDKTHLRFFTYKTAREMLEGSGLRICEDRKAGKFSLMKTLSAQMIFKCEEV